MSDDIYDNITNFKYIDFSKNDYSKIEHFVVSYIDDSTNCISSNDKIVLQTYLQRYYNLLHHFYVCNKLCLNEDKTQLLITSKKTLMEQSKNIKLNAGIYTIYTLVKQSKY